MCLARDICRAMLSVHHLLDIYFRVSLVVGLIALSQYTRSDSRLVTLVTKNLVFFPIHACTVTHVEMLSDMCVLIRNLRSVCCQVLLLPALWTQTCTLESTRRGLRQMLVLARHMQSLC